MSRSTLTNLMPTIWKALGGFITVPNSHRFDPLIGRYMQVQPADPSLGWWASKLIAYQDLMHDAKHRDTYDFVNGNRVLIPRGSIIMSVSALAAQWNWSTKTVRIFLDALERTGRITRKQWAVGKGYVADAQRAGQGKHPTMINLCEYDLYHGGGLLSEPARCKQEGKKTPSTDFNKRKHKGKQQLGSQPARTLPASRFNAEENNDLPKQHSGAENNTQGQAGKDIHMGITSPEGKARGQLLEKGFKIEKKEEKNRISGGPSIYNTTARADAGGPRGVGGFDCEGFREGSARDPQSHTPDPEQISFDLGDQPAEDLQMVLGFLDAPAIRTPLSVAPGQDGSGPSAGGAQSGVNASHAIASPSTGSPSIGGPSIGGPSIGGLSVHRVNGIELGSGDPAVYPEPSLQGGGSPEPEPEPEGPPAMPPRQPPVRPPGAIPRPSGSGMRAPPPERQRDDEEDLDARRGSMPSLPAGAEQNLTISQRAMGHGSGVMAPSPSQPSAAQARLGESSARGLPSGAGQSAPSPRGGAGSSARGLPSGAQQNAPSSRGGAQQNGFATGADGRAVWQLNPHAAAASAECWWSPAGRIEVSPVFAADLAKVFPLVDQASALAVASGEASLSDTGLLLRRKIERRFGYLQNEESGKQRRYEASVSSRKSSTDQSGGSWSELLREMQKGEN